MCIESIIDLGLVTSDLHIPKTGGSSLTKAMQLMDYSAQTTDEVVTKTSVSEEDLKSERDHVVMKRPAGVLKRPASKVHMFAFLVVVFLVA